MKPEPEREAAKPDDLWSGTIEVIRTKGQYNAPCSWLRKLDEKLGDRLRALDKVNPTVSDDVAG